MQVFRIAAPKYAQRLSASGVANRWNLAGQFVLYTASSASLACLENVVHRGAEGLQAPFKLMTITVPEHVLIEEVTLGLLPTGWQQVASYAQCQAVGMAWYQLQRSAVLKVPSAIITTEYNYLLNTTHPDFSQISLQRVEDFAFDSRLKREPR
jgi:RES domain-containing protein